MKWHFKEGDSVKADQTIVEVETDKAVVELPSPASGTILKINFKEGEVVKVGEVLVVVGQPGESVTASAQPAKTEPIKTTPAPIQSAPVASEGGRALATPSTRKLARDLNVDIAALKGTGPGGRITEDDVRKASTGEASPKGEKASAPSQPLAGPKTVSEEGDTRIPLTHMRKVIAERMLYSKTHIPHACGMDYVDVTRLFELREKEKKNFEPKGVKLTFLPFIAKACAIALKENPNFNAHFDNDNNEIILKKQINIGIAVDTQEGLVVPVIKEIERRSIIEIAQEIDHLASAAKDRKIKLEEIKGGTFTITNIGSVGGMYSSPIINPPEIAILGVHRIKDLPLVIDGRIKARKVLGLSICFDHRVVDGASATVFLNTVMKHLEDPDLMLVDMI